MVVDGEMKKLVGTGLAGFQRNSALIAGRKSGKNNVIPDFADFLENAKAIARAVANRIEVEQDRMQLRLFEEGFDFVLIGGQRSSEFTAKMFANLREELCVISDDG